MSVSRQDVADLLSPILAEVRRAVQLGRENLEIGRLNMTTLADIAQALSSSHDKEIAAKNRITQLEATNGTLTEQNTSLQAQVTSLQAASTNSVDPSALQPQLDALLQSGVDLDEVLAHATAPSTIPAPAPVMPAPEPPAPAPSLDPVVIAPGANTPDTPSAVLTPVVPEGTDAVNSVNPSPAEVTVPADSPDVIVTGTAPAVPAVENAAAEPTPASGT